jgi:hypothetical protein
MVLERTALIEIDEKHIQPEVVSCQVGHNDMKVRVQGSRDYYRGEVVPGYEFWLPHFGGAPCTTGTGPTAIRNMSRSSSMDRSWRRRIVPGFSSSPVCRLATTP